MFDMHMMDYWLHKMSASSKPDILWEQRRRRAHAYAYACGYLGED